MERNEVTFFDWQLLLAVFIVNIFRLAVVLIMLIRDLLGRCKFFEDEDEENTTPFLFITPTVKATEESETETEVLPTVKHVEEAEVTEHVE